MTAKYDGMTDEAQELENAFEAVREAERKVHQGARAIREENARVEDAAARLSIARGLHAANVADRDEARRRLREVLDRIWRSEPLVEPRRQAEIKFKTALQEFTIVGRLHIGTAALEDLFDSLSSVPFTQGRDFGDESEAA